MAEISRVNLDIARFAREVYQRQDDAELGRWVRNMADALVMRDPALNIFASHLLCEAAEYAEKFSARQRENAQKRWEKRDAMASSGIAVASGGNAKPSQPMPIHSFNQSDQAKEEVKTPLTPQKQPDWFEAPEFTLFRDQAFAAAWRDWERARKKRAGERQYRTLVKLAGGDVSAAIAILTQSADQQWAGLFPLKGDRNGHHPIPGNAPGQRQPAGAAGGHRGGAGAHRAEKAAREFSEPPVDVSSLALR